MQCELCGGLMKEGFRVSVEGSVVVACAKCGKLGKVVGRINPEEKNKKQVNKQPRPAESFEIEGPGLSDDFYVKIKSCREKTGLKQEDLAKAINEPSSVIHRIESGRMIPSPSVIKKIEANLGITLREKKSGVENVLSGSKGGKEVTLGDIIVVRKKKD